MITAGVGLSQNVNDHRGAGMEAARQAEQKLAGAPAHLVFAFSSVKYDQKEVLRGIREVFSVPPVLGGSAAGEIVSWDTVFDGVNVMAVSCPGVTVAVAESADVSKDSFEAGRRVAEQVVAKNGGAIPTLFILLPDGITGNGADIVEGVKSVLGNNAPLIGGSLGDDYRFKQTYEYYNDEVLSDAVIGVGLTGSFSFGFGIRHGWEPVGLSLVVTKAEGTVIKEIDGKPALKVYENYFGKDAGELVKEPLARIAYTYPLGLAVPGSDELLIRDPVVANEKGEITVAAAVPEGSTVRLMIGDRDKAIEAAKYAARVAKEQLGSASPRLIIVFNCMARNKLLGVRCSEENKAVQEIIGADIPMAGFYTYGEQGPLRGEKGTPAYFHNETMTLVVLGD